MVYLGIEIGGSKLQLGVGPGDGTLAALWRGSVDVAAGPEGIRRQIIAAVPELLAKAGMERSQLAGAGIGFGGPVDDRTRTVIKSHQIAGWDNFPLADWVSNLVSLPAVLGNDADVAGLAEALFGAGKGLSPIFYITIGSGIGGGLIIDGEIFRGCGRGAAEIGHMRFGDFTLEEKASGWSIGRRAREAATQQGGRPARAGQIPHSIHQRQLFPDSVLSRLVHSRYERITAVHVAQAAVQGDAFAQYLLNETWLFLAEAIAQVIALICPRRIVIGGGVAQMGEILFFEPLRIRVAERVFKPFAGCYDIVPAALGEEVVVHGALALARRRLGAHSQDV
jgi:glucokinase